MYNCTLHIVATWWPGSWSRWWLWWQNSLTTILINDDAAWCPLHLITLYNTIMRQGHYAMIINMLSFCMVVYIGYLPDDHKICDQKLWWVISDSLKIRAASLTVETNTAVTKSRDVWLFRSTLDLSNNSENNFQMWKTFPIFQDKNRIQACYDHTPLWEFQFSDERGSNSHLGEPLHRRRQLSNTQLNERGCEELRSVTKGSWTTTLSGVFSRYYSLITCLRWFSKLTHDNLIQVAQEAVRIQGNTGYPQVSSF